MEGRYHIKQKGHNLSKVGGGAETMLSGRLAGGRARSILVQETHVASREAQPSPPQPLKPGSRKSPKPVSAPPRGQSPGQVAERWPSVGTRARVEPSPECVCGPRWPLHPSHPGRAGWHPPSLSRLAGKPRRYSNRKLLAGGSPTIILPVNGKNKSWANPGGRALPPSPASHLC